MILFNYLSLCLPIILSTKLIFSPMLIYKLKDQSTGDIISNYAKVFNCRSFYLHFITWKKACGKYNSFTCVLLLFILCITNKKRHTDYFMQFFLNKNRRSAVLKTDLLLSQYPSVQYSCGFSSPFITRSAPCASASSSSSPGYNVTGAINPTRSFIAVVTRSL